MTYTSDMQLRAAGLKPLADLPNKHFFAFTGMSRKGEEMLCYVALNPHSSLHEVVGHDFNDLIGWKYRPQ